MPDDAITHCVNRGVVGFGRLPPREQLRDVEWTAWLAGTIDHGRHPRAVSSHSGVRWLAPDDLVWARDGSGHHYLGRVSGPWAIDESEEAQNADVVHVVPCQLRHVGRDDALPTVVSRSFRFARRLQPIADLEGVRFSQLCWNEVSASVDYRIDLAGATLPSVLDITRLADLLLILLQSRGWIVMGSARDRNQSAHAATLVHRETTARATLLVGTGEYPLDPRLLAKAEHGERAFLFHREGLYSEQIADHVTCLDPAEVEAFARSNLGLMPAIIGIWLRALDARRGYA